MQLSNSLLKSVFLLSLVAALAACSSPAKKAEDTTTAAPPAAVKEAPVAVDNPATATTAAEQAPVAKPAQVPEKPVRVLSSIFFGFDSDVIDDANYTALKARSEDLKSVNPDNVTLEGNADERGSNEYNLALASRRAEKVKQALQALGFDKKVKTVSNGEEKPVSLEHTEEGWAQNRRVDFVY